MKNYCYYHKHVLGALVELHVDKPQDAYCNKRERELWIDAVYGKKKTKSLDYIQKKLSEMGKKADVAVNETKPIFSKKDLAQPTYSFTLDH